MSIWDEEFNELDKYDFEQWLDSINESGDPSKDEEYYNKEMARSEEEYLGDMLDEEAEMMESAEFPEFRVAGPLTIYVLTRSIKMKNWLAEDWKNNRFRLVCETLGSFAFILIYLLMAWYGDDVCITTIFLIQLVGSSLHIINAYMRNSVNLIVLNLVVIVIALFGLGPRCI